MKKDPLDKVTLTNKNMDALRDLLDEIKFGKTPKPPKPTSKTDEEMAQFFAGFAWPPKGKKP